MVGDKKSFIKEHYDALRTRVYLLSICCFVFTIIYENNYSNIGLIIAIAGFLFFSKKKEIFMLIKNKAFLFLCFNVLIFLIGLIFIDPTFFNTFSGRIGKSFLLIIIPIIIFPLRSIERYNVSKYLMISFISSIALALFLIYFYAIFMNKGIKFPFAYNMLTRGIGGVHPVYFSLFCAMGFFIVLELMTNRIKVIYRIFYGALLICILSTMILLNSRMPIIAFFISLLVYIYFKIKILKSYKFILYITILLIVSVGLLYMCLDQSKINLLKDRFVNNFLMSLSSRIEIWECSWSIYENGNNRFFGLGSGNVQQLLNNCYKEKFLTRSFFSSYNVHNEHLLVLVRNGMLGLTFWLLMLGYGFYKSIKNKSELGTIFMILFTICAFTEVYFNRVWGILFFGVFYSFYIINTFTKSNKVVNPNIEYRS